MSHQLRWSVVSIAVALLGIAAMVTGFQNGVVGIGLIVTAAILAAWARWPWLGQMVIRSPFYRAAGTASEKNRDGRDATRESTMVELFTGRTALEEAYPILEQVRRATSIDGLWLAGRAILNIDDNNIVRTARRVILPDPKSPILDELQNWSDDIYRTLGNAIYESTERARKLGVQVRWLMQFPGFTLFLGNPDDDDGWAQLELLLPFTEPGRRPILRIERAHQPMLFERLTKAFDALWQKAKPPPEQLFT